MSHEGKAYKHVRKYWHMLRSICCCVNKFKERTFTSKEMHCTTKKRKRTNNKLINDSKRILDTWQHKREELFHRMRCNMERTCTQVWGKLSQNKSKKKKEKQDNKKEATKQLSINFRYRSMRQRRCRQAASSHFDPKLNPVKIWADYWVRFATAYTFKNSLRLFSNLINAIITQSIQVK